MKRLPTLESFIIKEQSEDFMSLDQMKTDLKPAEDWLSKNGFTKSTKYGANVNVNNKREAGSAWENDKIRVFLFRGQLRNGRYVKDPYFETSIKTISGNKYYHDVDFMSGKTTSDELVSSLKKHIPLAMKQINENSDVNESMSPNVKKYLDAYNKFNEIELKWHNREMGEFSSSEKKDLQKEYKKYANEMNKLAERISREDFEQYIEPETMFGYEDFLDSWGTELHESDSDKMYQPPSGAVGNAKKVLKWKEEHGDEVTAMTQTGWARARQLASGEKVSRDIVGRMANFARHEKNSKVDPKYKNEPWKDKGYVAWLGWGGDTGINWAKEIVANE